MYGMVNVALEDFIREAYGDAAWVAIKARAGVDVDVFIRMDSYPDEMSFNLVSAACEVLHLSAETILFAFGEFWALYFGAQGFGALLDSTGSTLFELLANLDDLHARVGLMYPNLKPPSFRCTDVTEDHLVLHYYSIRQGLTPMVMGLVQGLARKRFGVTVEMRQLLSRTKGDDHDSFSVRVLPQ